MCDEHHFFNFLSLGKHHPLPHLTISPIQLNETQLNETQFECHPHSECRHPNLHQPFISIMNDTYLVVFNN